MDNEALLNGMHHRHGHNEPRKHTGMYVFWNSVVVMLMSYFAVYGLYNSNHEECSTPIKTWFVCFCVGIVGMSIIHMIYLYLQLNMPKRWDIYVYVLFLYSVLFGFAVTGAINWIRFTAEHEKLPCNTNFIVTIYISVIICDVLLGICALCFVVIILLKSAWIYREGENNCKLIFVTLVLVVTNTIILVATIILYYMMTPIS